MISKNQRKNNQKYHPEEFNTPFALYDSERVSQTSKKVTLKSVDKGLGLVHDPSAKDKVIFDTRLQATSLTLIVPQRNTITINSDMIVKLQEPRINSAGFFDVVEIIPDIRNGRYLKMLLNRTKQGATFEVKNG